MSILDKFEEILEMSEYELNLVQINLEKKDNVTTKNLSLAIAKDCYGFKEVKKNTYEVIISVEILGIKSSYEESLEKFENIDEKRLIFNMKVAYKVSIDTKLQDEQLTNTSDCVNKYAWFVVYPTMKDLINNLGNRIGLPNINIPYNMSGDEDEC